MLGDCYAMKVIVASAFLTIGLTLPSFGGERLPDVENVVNGYALAVVGSKECDGIRSIPDADQRLEKMKVLTAFNAVKSGLSESEFKDLLEEAGINGFLALQLNKAKACRAVMKMFDAIR